MFKDLTFTCLKNKAFVGYVNASSLGKAQAKALGLYGRCEVMLSKDSRGMGVIGRIARDTDSSFTHGRAPYATPGFEARRAALIAAHKAGA